MRHFDTVVIGNEIAGLVAGALLAKGGQRVLHLDPRPSLTTYKLGEQVFHRQLRFFSSWDASPAPKRAFFDLNLITDMSRRLGALQPAFQLVVPGHRVDIAGEPESLGEELEREYPGSGRAALEALRKVEEANERLDQVFDGNLILPPEKWAEKRELKRIVQENPLPAETEFFGDLSADHPLLTISALARRFTSYLDPTSSDPVRVARAARYVLKGIFEFPQGCDGLKEMLSGVIRHYHGDARGEEIDDVVVKWGRVAAFHLAGGEVIGCDQVIAADPVGRMLDRFPSASNRGYLNLVGQLRPSHRVYTLNLVIGKNGVPEGMGPVGFWHRDPAQPPDGANLVLWLLRGEDTLRTLTLACWIPSPDSREAAFWRGLKASLLKALPELMPFVEPHILEVDCPWADGESSGPHVRPLEEMEETYLWDGESALGVSALPVRTPLKNLVLANRQVLPALGLEGEFLTGATAARMLRGKKEKKVWFDQ